ncbi:phage tail protein [Mesorhizobium sp. WSM2239]|uniref:Phage tail protein n=2 Tax=unclassified Mesorhizobium TaxID=325217 RepID=A0AAU8D1G9_9HYPH
MKPFAGNFGGGDAPENTPDTYYSSDIIEVILGLTEGPIKGLKSGTAKNFYVGETPLLNSNGSENFTDFTLNIHKGSSTGELIVPRLGGQSTSVTVNTSLSQDIAVIRQGTQLDIDWVELRFVINALFRGTDEGQRSKELKIQVEYKPSDQSEWLPGILYSQKGTTTEETPNSLTIIHSGDIKAVTTAARQQVLYDQTAEPVPTEDERSLADVYGHRVWWLDDNGALRFYSNADFFSPDNLTSEAVGTGRVNITFEDANYIALIDPTRAIPERRFFHWATGTPTGAVLGDLWYNNAVLRWFNGASWVTTLSPTGTYDPTAGHNVISSDGVLRMNEKITSNAVKEVKIKVPRIGVPYDIRVTKLTHDTEDTEDDRTDVTFESFQEIKAEPMLFPNLAVAHLLGRATDQFSSVPQFSGVYEGLLVKVPSNYDPVARTYDGAWDGTWKIAYTNNPAYVGNDLVMNDRYGMNSTYPVELEPTDVYEAGVWCDLERGDSGKPLFTFNQLIQEPQTARELATYIFGIFGGRFFDDGNGYARLRIDNDTPAVHLFAKENIKEGVFKYSYTEMEGRKNDYTVSFKNPALFYKEDRRRVRSQEMIDAYGRAPDEFIAVGCNNADEAIFRATVKLISDQTEVETVTFETAREGLYLEPYDIILVSDDAMDDVTTGRIVGTSGSDTLLLRDFVYLEAGFDHEVVINREGFELATFEIDPTSVGVSTKTLKIVGVLPTDLPDQAVFSIGLDAKPYRVLGIAPGEGKDSEESVIITGLEVNRTKYAEAAGQAEAVQVEIPEFSTNLSAVANARLTPSTEVRLGRSVQNLLLTYDAHPNKFVRSYTIASRFNDDPWRYHGDVRTTRFELADVLQGRYIFSIQANSMMGQRSAITYVDIDLSGEVREVAPVTNLVLVNEIGVDGSNHLFEERDAHLQWNKGEPNPAQASYRVEIYDSGEELLRSEFVVEPKFTYTGPQMFADGATRQMKVRVTAFDLFGNSSEPAILLIKNPAPAAPAVSAENGFGSVQFNWPTDNVADYAGSLVWISPTSGIDPTSRPADYELVGNQVVVPLSPDTGRYARVALFDTMGKQELNYSAEVYAEAYLVVDVEAPATPTGLVLSSVITDGVCKLTATCNANTEADLAGYIFEIKEGAGNYVGFPTNEARYEWTVKAGVAYTVTVLAFDQAQNKSNRTAEVAHTAALDTVPPATPTGLNALGGFEVIWLKLNRNGEADFSHYEIYQHTASTPEPDAGTVATYTSRSENNPISGFTGVQQLWFWVRAVDTSGNKSAWSASVEGTTVDIDTDITTEDLAGLIDATSFAAGLYAPGVGATLPATPFTDTTPKTFYLTTDQKIYEQKADGSGWIVSSDVSLIVGQIKTGQIEVGAVGADQIASNAVLTKHLLIGNMNNLVTNSQFITGDLSDWSEYYNPDGITVEDAGAAGVPASAPARKVVKYVPSSTLNTAVFSNGGAHNDPDAGILVTPGEKYYFAIDYAEDAGSVNFFRMYAYYRNVDGTYSSQLEYLPASTSWIRHGVTFTVPVGAYKMHMYLIAVTGSSGNRYWCNPTVNRVSGTVLIEDGAITAEKVTTGELITLSAQIKDAIIKNAHISDLSAEKLIAGSALANTITVDGRSIGSVAKSDILFDDVSQDWTLGSGYGSGSYSTDAVATGTRRLLQNADGYRYWYCPNRVAFDPSKLYRVTFRIKRIGGDDTGTVYAGLRGFNAAGTSVATGWSVLSAKAQSSIASATWTEFVGYVKGVATAQQSGLGTIATPKAMIDTTRFIEPVILFNYNLTSGGCSMALDSVKIEVVTEEAAELVNAGSTKIDPGMITISGGTTLASWRHGTDQTKIDGGNIYANSITANSLNIGQRGIEIMQLEFEHNKPSTNQLSWTAGTITYINDANASAFSSITAGSVTHTGPTVYIYWAKGATTLSTTTVQATAQGANNVILAIYRGGTDLTANYGRTIIDGSGIKANTVDTLQLKANAVDATIIKADAVEGYHIKANSITAREMVLTNFTNLIPNGNFGTGDLSSWRGWATPTAITVPASTSWPAKHACLLNNNASDVSIFSHGDYRDDAAGIPVSAGEQYLLGADFWVNSSTTCYLYAYFKKNDATYTSISYAIPVAGSWNRRTLALTVPAGCVKMHMYVRRTGGGTGHMYFTNAFINRRMDAELVVDGAITANHITVTNLAAISATLGAVNISAAIIGTLQVQTANIANLAVDTIKVKDGAITSIATAFTAAAVNCPEGAERILQTLAISVNNSNSKVSVNFSCNLVATTDNLFKYTDANSSSICDLRLYRDNVLVHTVRIWQFLYMSDNGFVSVHVGNTAFILDYTDTAVAAGSRTYQVRAYYDQRNFDIENRMLRVMDVKK